MYNSKRNQVFLSPNGSKMSVATGDGIYCTPKDAEGPYTHVEVGFPTGKIPASWMSYDDGSGDIFGYLPVELLADWFMENK